MKSRVLIVLDRAVPSGEIHIGGPAVLRNPSDEELGFACTSKLIRVGSEEDVMRLEDRLRMRDPDVHIRRTMVVEG